MKLLKNQKVGVTLSHSKGERKGLCPPMLRVPAHDMFCVGCHAEPVEVRRVKARPHSLRQAQTDSALMSFLPLQSPDSITQHDSALLKFVGYFCILLLLSACGGKHTSADPQQQTATQDTTATASNKKAILFFGDSLTAGYGLDDPSNAFPGVIQRKIDSLKLPYAVINAGVSGETTAGGLARTDWVLRQKPDVFVLELGANDGLRGIPVAETTKNLQSIIDKVKAKYPDAKIILAGMQVPPSMGHDYITSFRNLFPALAQKNKVALVPFLLAGVGGNPKLNQTDGIHPTAEGAKIVANNVWTVLKEEL